MLGVAPSALCLELSRLHDGKGWHYSFIYFLGTILNGSNL